MFNIKETIKSVDDVKSFFNYLVKERQCNFHCDDDFKEYSNYETNEHTFTDEEADELNARMNEAFDVCEANNTDIYELGLNALNSALVA